MKYKIGIIGSGQLGSRYLQGLMNFQDPISVWVYDISLAALNNSKLKMHEVENSKVHDCNFQNKFESLPEHLDLCIVCTTADTRLNVIKNVQNKIAVKNWILEKVLAQSVEDLYAIKNLIPPTQNVWVNCPRREVEWYLRIKESINYSNKISIEVSGGAWGLACNSVHYLDLASWVANGAKLVNLNTKKLQNKWVPAKRIGFWEVFGELHGEFADGSLIRIVCDEAPKERIIKISNSDMTWTVHEDRGVATNSIGEQIDARMPLQSESTTSLLRKIIHNPKTVLLPTLIEAISIHEPFLTEMLKQWNAANHLKSTSVPIT
jgi:hypothetical protein